ncbi:hypothetical protein Glove_117g261 [Diversispora epigaea]|uniref:Uncharacterized protein n=1 Tax=Diversispora epigaea TaxID=1348612 RepID=A0A397J0F9_9GLOM|nr:hypothetical protein Glove_117g261 [Diversispora epigaea]
MLGLILITVYDIVLQKVVTHELADQIMDDVFVQFKLFLHTHIWKDRCTAVKKWETENGISNNKWKKKIRNETLDTIVTSQTNNTDNNSVLNNIELMVKLTVELVVKPIVEPIAEPIVELTIEPRFKPIVELMVEPRFKP